jgi:hypothetical protein
MTLAKWARIPSAFSGPEDTKHVPVVFQIISPDRQTLLLPHAMYLHVNPNSLDLAYSKIITRISTQGGFVEQHFGDQLTDITASGSTGSFMSVQDGVTTVNRKNTIAYHKFQQLIDVFKSNGSVYDDRGVVQFRGGIRLTFGGGVYDGYFLNLEFSETSERPFDFEVNWSFKAEREVYNLLY